MSSFFKHPADGLIADRLDHFQLHELVGQERQRPAGAAGRRGRAGQGNQAGFGSPVQLAQAARAVLRLVGQGGVEAALDEALADALDGAVAAAQRLGDLGVLPGGAAVGLVGLEEDTGAGDGAGGPLAGRDELAQLPALLGGQGHEIPLLCHGVSYRNR